MNQENQSPPIKGNFALAWIKRHPIWSTLFILFLIGHISSSTSTSPENESTTNTPAAKSQLDPQKQVAATKELQDLMKLSAKGDLVHSYAFGVDKLQRVYVGSAWYLMDVGFKKDFMAKIALLLKDINGRDYFEVHDAYSDEKVGEVTAFSGSIEVYR